MIKQPWGLARLPAMTTQPPSAPAEHLAVVHALRVFSESAEHAVDEAGRGVGLHRTDLRALALLMARAAAGEPVTASDLGAHLHLTRASATALVDRLAAAGHVRRRRDEGDRRRVLVEHTDTARRDGQRAFQPMSQRLSAALEGFSVAELRAAVRVLEAATAALTDPTPEDP